jgi:hypothetical protein
MQDNNAHLNETLEIGDLEYGIGSACASESARVTEIIVGGGGIGFAYRGPEQA